MRVAGGGAHLAGDGQPLPVDEQEVLSRMGYPCFSEAEMAHRHQRLAAVLEDNDVRQVLLYGADRSGSAVQWLTGWPVTREAVLVWAPGRPEVLVVQFYNHVPNARRLAPGVEVRWGGPSTIDVVLDALAANEARPSRVGVVGPFPARLLGPLAAGVEDVVFLDQAYAGLRLTKSEEEVAWIRRGASLTDRAVGALAAEGRAGRTEAELGAVIEGAYLGTGAVNHIHYLGVTSMHDPEVCVPA
ncbi:MAG: hypothetical protein ACRDZQ_04900, partial [Acidimicrobiales bacterium]